MDGQHESTEAPYRPNGSGTEKTEISVHVLSDSGGPGEPLRKVQSGDLDPPLVYPRGDADHDRDWTDGRPGQVEPIVQSRAAAVGPSTTGLSIQEVGCRPGLAAASMSSVQPLPTSGAGR